MLNDKRALLFQDMFPLSVNYIQAPYLKGNQLVRIENEKLIAELSKIAKSIIAKLHNGVEFTITQPDVGRIEQLMLSELEQEKTSVITAETPTNPEKQDKPNFGNRLKIASTQANEHNADRVNPDKSAKSKENEIA